MKETKGRNGGTLKSMEKGETLNPNGRPKKQPELEVVIADVLGIERATQTGQKGQRSGGGSDTEPGLWYA